MCVPNALQIDASARRRQSVAQASVDVQVALRMDWQRSRLVTLKPTPSRPLMAAPVAAVIIAKEKDLIAHFRRAGALSPTNAKSVTELGVDTRLAWTILERRAIIRQAGEGLYYLDESAWLAHQKRRRRIAMTMLVIVLTLLAVSTLVTMYATAARR